MKKVKIIPYTPPDYWSIDKSFDGVYSVCRFHQKGEFVTKFPIIMKAKVNVPLKNQLGDEEYISYIMDILNEPPDPPKYKGRGRRPKAPRPIWGKLEMIRYRFRKEKKLDIVELTMYTNKKKHKRLLNFGTIT
jgi:hypothetical protein